MEKTPWTKIYLLLVEVNYKQKQHYVNSISYRSFAVFGKGYINILLRGDITAYCLSFIYSYAIRYKGLVLFAETFYHQENYK